MAQRKMKRGKGRWKVCEGGRLGRNEGRECGTAVMQEYGEGGEAGREKCRYVCYGGTEAGRDGGDGKRGKARSLREGREGNGAGEMEVMRAWLTKAGI